MQAYRGDTSTSRRANTKPIRVPMATNSSLNALRSTI